MLKIKIAFRNVIRNRRRTFISTAMIAGGIAAIAVFQGLSHNLLFQMREKIVSLQFGHLQIASHRTWERTPGDRPKDRMITIDPALKNKIERRNGVAYASGRINFYSMINFGEQSLSAHGTAYDPQVETHMGENRKLVQGRNLDKNNAREIVLGTDLARPLGIKAGDTITVMGYTYDGAMNAYDLQVVGIFQSGFELVDNTFNIPLGTAQQFLDTDGIEEFVVQLENTDNTDAMKTWLQAELPKDLAVKSWVDLSDFYRQLVDFQKVQTRVVMWIFMVLALMATLNTVSLTIFERTGEIGTQRAMGDSRTAILEQFVIEGLISGLIGGALGCGLGLLSAKMLNLSALQITLPGSAFPSIMQIDVMPGAFRDAILAMSLVALAATLIPAYRASHMEIVEALKRNI